MSSSWSAFSLAELLVVMAIISVLVALLLPAVQSARESARRTTCTNNLHNHATALAQYHAAHGQLPPGRLGGDPASDTGLDFSWAALVLPHVEQRSLHRQLDLRKPWDDEKNERATKTSLAIFQCPSVGAEFPGQSDYGGILGSAMQTLEPDESANLGVAGFDVFNRGVLIHAHFLREGIRFGQVTDGLSNTLAVAEAANSEEEEGGFWACGANSTSHDSGSVNSSDLGIRGVHPGGANAARADGSVSFLTESVEPLVIGALCTRATGDDASP